MVTTVGQDKALLSSSAERLIDNIINIFLDEFGSKKVGKEREAVVGKISQYAKAIVDDLSKNNAVGVDELKEAAIDKIRNELATKDFVRAEIAELRTELKAEIAELRTELKAEIAELRTEIAELRTEIKNQKRDLKFWGIAIIFVMFIFQPRTFDLIQSIFGFVK